MSLWKGVSRIPSSPRGLYGSDADPGNVNVGQLKENHLDNLGKRNQSHDARNVASITMASNMTRIGASIESTEMPDGIAVDGDVRRVPPQTVSCTGPPRPRKLLPEICSPSQEHTMESVVSASRPSFGPRVKWSCTFVWRHRSNTCNATFRKTINCWKELVCRLHFKEETTADCKLNCVCTLKVFAPVVCTSKQSAAGGTRILCESTDFCATSTNVWTLRERTVHTCVEALKTSVQRNPSKVNQPSEGIGVSPLCNKSMYNNAFLKNANCWEEKCRAGRTEKSWPSTTYPEICTFSKRLGAHPPHSSKGVCAVWVTTGTGHGGIAEQGRNKSAETFVTDSHNIAVWEFAGVGISVWETSMNAKRYWKRCMVMNVTYKKTQRWPSVIDHSSIQKTTSDPKSSSN